MEQFEDQKKKLIYLGIALVVVTLASLAYSFFGTSKNSNQNESGDMTGYYILDSTQKEEMDSIALAYMNSDFSFYKKEQLNIENLTDEQKKLISFILMVTYHTYPEGSLVSDGKGCQKIVMSANDYNNLTSIYFGDNQNVLRKNTLLHMDPFGNYGDVAFDYHSTTNQFVISGNYLCDQRKSGEPTTQYAIHKKHYKQEGNKVTLTIHYYYRKLASQAGSSYINYDYHLYQGSKKLFELTFEPTDAFYSSDIARENQMIEKYDEQLYGLKLEFELLPNSYIKLNSIKTKEPEIS